MSAPEESEDEGILTDTEENSWFTSLLTTTDTKIAQQNRAKDWYSNCSARSYSDLISEKTGAPKLCVADTISQEQEIREAVVKMDRLLGDFRVSQTRRETDSVNLFISDPLSNFEGQLLQEQFVGYSNKHLLLTAPPGEEDSNALYLEIERKETPKTIVPLFVEKASRLPEVKYVRVVINFHGTAEGHMLLAGPEVVAIDDIFDNLKSTMEASPAFWPEVTLVLGQGYRHKFYQKALPFKVIPLTSDEAPNTEHGRPDWEPKTLRDYGDCLTEAISLSDEELEAEQRLQVSSMMQGAGSPEDESSSKMKQETEEGVDTATAGGCASDDSSDSLEPQRSWLGNPVNKITPEMAKFLFKISGFQFFGLDGDKVISIYCDPSCLGEAEKQLEEFYTAFDEPSMCLIASDTCITPANIDQSWQQHCMHPEHDLLSECCCAIGLPVTVGHTGLDGVPQKPGILGCCHSMIAIAHSVGASPTLRRNDGDVLVTEYELATDGKHFSAHLDDNSSQLGTKAVGVLGERFDASLTYLNPPQDIAANAPQCLSLSNDVINEGELEDVLGKAVWKRGPITGSTDGEIILTNVGFTLQCDNVPPKQIENCIAAMRCYNTTGRPFAEKGDSGSVVFCKDMDKQEGKPLGAVSAVKNKVPIRLTQNRDAQEQLAELGTMDARDKLIHRNRLRRDALRRRNGVAFIVPYYYQIDALLQKHCLEVWPKLN